MKVKELVDLLSKVKQDADVMLMIENPKDSAYTLAEITVREDEEGTVIAGWVASDDDNAHLPGY